jgi:general stress protein YciG
VSLTTEQKIQRARESGRKGGLKSKALREAKHATAPEQEPDDNRPCEECGDPNHATEDC